MVGFAHIVLHLTLCHSLAALPPNATIDAKVHLSDATGRQKSDHEFSIPRGSTMTHMVEFDAPRGAFRVTMVTADNVCGFTDFWSMISESPRSIQETLTETATPQQPIVLLEGTAPQSFLSADPQFVLLPKDTACASKVEDPPAANLRLENDGSSFYIWMDLTEARNSLLALQVGTPTGENHYIRTRVPIDPWGGFPETVQFNLSEDAIDWLAGQPIDTLLCPHAYWSSVGS
jgi:hypothetical protein